MASTGSGVEKVMCCIAEFSFTLFFHRVQIDGFHTFHSTAFIHWYHSVNCSYLACLLTFTIITNFSFHVQYSYNLIPRGACHHALITYKVWWSVAKFTNLGCFCWCRMYTSLSFCVSCLLRNGWVDAEIFMTYDYKLIFMCMIVYCKLQ